MSKLKLHPNTQAVVCDADTFDSILTLLEDLKTYIKKTGERVKYTQPEQFAAVCQTYRNRIENELKNFIQLSENPLINKDGGLGDDEA